MRAPLRILSGGTDRFQSGLQQLGPTSPGQDLTHLGASSEGLEVHVELQTWGLPTFLLFKCWLEAPLGVGLAAKGLLLCWDLGLP